MGSGDADEESEFWVLGNGLGQSIENKGREYGAYIRAGDFRWWVRETGIESMIFAHACNFVIIIF